MKANSFKFKKSDYIILAILVAIGVIIALVTSFNASFGSKVAVRIDGMLITEYSLNKDTTETIESEYGKNTLIIEGGSAYIKDASCPDGLCIHMGKISKNGQSIICLPNKLVVEISDETNDTNLDSMTGGNP